MNYRRNEDKIVPAYSGLPNNYNSVEVTEIEVSETEPVTLDEVKNWLRLEGFVDDGESPTTELADFDADDDIITELITDAREAIEEYSGKVLIPKTLSAKIYSGAGNIRLPGPVISISSYLDADETEITEYTLTGDVIKESFDGYRIVEYEAGYGDDIPIPKKYKTAIKMYVAASYTHRGDEQKEGIYKQALKKAGAAPAFF